MDTRTIVIHSSIGRGEYFFSTDHCQGVRTKTYPAGFVPITFTLPHAVVARPTCPSGWVETVSDVVAVYFPDSKEIPNPEPSYQPEKV